MDIIRVRVNGMKHMDKNRDRKSNIMYQSQERKLVWLTFIVAAIMLLSIIGRVIGG
ncbi:hypothetical protein [Ornithinibacillus halotolerans]|uniref:hypothetical protein n=1 Tax=Ornithinibacillus halotolerans TaxID=1274357 RepID=UPI001666488B|nr:hypothetical protein [Ornithinibacillus halotolerans]